MGVWHEREKRCKAARMENSGYPGFTVEELD